MVSLCSILHNNNGCFSKFLPLKGFVVNDSKQNSELRAPKMWRSSFPFGQETLKFCLPGASLS